MAHVWSRCCRLDLEELGGSAAASNCRALVTFRTRGRGIRRLLIPLLGLSAQSRASKSRVTCQTWETMTPSPAPFSTWAAVAVRCFLAAKQGMSLQCLLASASRRCLSATRDLQEGDPVTYSYGEPGARDCDRVLLESCATQRFRVPVTGIPMNTLPCTTATVSERQDRLQIGMCVSPLQQHFKKGSLSSAPGVENPSSAKYRETQGKSH